jgi:hypothetical protein
MYGPRPPDWFTGDGCSFSPDGFWGRNWREACRYHDWAYRQPIPITRWIADVYFYHNLRLRGCPRRWAVWYFLVVRMMGWSCWQKHA